MLLTMRRAAHFYMDLADRFPKLVNGTTGFVIAGVGDYLCQRYFEYPRKLKNDILSADWANDFKSNPTSKMGFIWDKRRTLDMSLIRAFVITPFVMKWYCVLSKLCPGQSFRSAFGRILLDQSFGSPLAIVLVFIASSILKGDISKSLDTINGQFYDTWLTGMSYWPFIQMVNFRFISLKNQPLVAHFASVYWNAVLSYYSNKDTKIEKNIITVDVDTN